MRHTSEGKHPTGAWPRLALVDFPVALRVEAHLEEAVFGIVTFAAAGASQVAAPGGSVTIVIFGHRERSAATAGDQEHAKWARILARIN